MPYSLGYSLDVKNSMEGAEKMSHLVTCLPHKHNNASLSSQYPCEEAGEAAVCTGDPCTREGTQEDPGAST